MKRIKQASGIKITQCDECGSVHLIFLNSTDEPFAEFVADPELACNITADLCEICEEFFEDDDEEDGPLTHIGECQGSA